MPKRGGGRTKRTVKRRTAKTKRADAPTHRRTAKAKLPPAAERIGPIIALLAERYPEARCSLDHQDPLQLLVATILSAQCTDARVNVVTKTLFEKYRSAVA